MTPSTKADLFWCFIISAFVLGFWSAATYSSLRWRNELIQVEITITPTEILTEQEVIEQAIFPVEQGKRSDPGVLAPETLRAIENEAAKHIERDPFERLK